jgi:hypothetical protein
MDARAEKSGYGFSDEFLHPGIRYVAISLQGRYKYL